jgi:tetratricopeptide (TPR) repeat protein
MILKEPPLVGREQEVTELNHLLDKAVAGSGCTVFISGEAGSGKTRLTREFLDVAKEKGIHTLSGWCLSNAAVPYFPFLEAFESKSSNQENIGSNFQELALKTLFNSSEENHGISTQTWKDQKFAAVTKEVLFMSTDKPLILFIDDLHWADSASLALLHYIARVVTSERILVLATFRSEQLNLAKDGFVNPLTDTLRLMQREDLFQEIKLTNLNSSNVGLIAESILGSKVHQEFVDKLAVECHGNPLFVIETLKMLLENGSLLQEANQWQLSVDKVSIPIKVKDVILRRLSLLSAGQRRTLDVASVIGDKFDVQLLSSALNSDSLEVLETLNAIALSKSLVNVEGDYFKFDHSKTREVLYDEILTPLKKGYHQRVAERLENLNKNTELMPVVDLAYHYKQAGNKQKAIHYSLAAGKDALARFSNAEAINDFTFVLQNLQDDSFEKADALEGLGDAYQASMKFKEAAKSFESFVSMGGNGKVRGLRKAMEATFFQNDIPHLVDLIGEAEKCNITDRIENARILMNKGRVIVMQGDQGGGTKYFEDALRVFEEEYSLWDTAWVLIALGSNASGAGKFEEAAMSALRSISLFNELGDVRWLVEAYSMAGMTFATNFGFCEEGLLMLEKAEQLNENAKLGDYLRLAQINAESAWAYSSLRDPKNALAKDLKALKYAEKTDSFWGKGMAYANLTIDYSVLGDVSNAEEYFDRLMKLPPESLKNRMVNAQLAKAMLLAGKKQWEPSIQIFDGILTSLKAKPNPGIEAIVKSCYGWALFKRKHLLKALAQIREAKKIYKDMAERFAHVNLQPNIMAPAKVIIDQNFEARLDLVNVSRANGKLIRIENILHPDLSIELTSSEFIIQNGAIDFGEKSLEPLSVTSLKFNLKAKKASIFHINPRIVYKDDSGKIKTTQVKSLKIQSISTNTEHKIESTPEIIMNKFEFKNESAQTAFDFLVSSFRDDYKNRRMPQERSGWRTFMDIVRDGKVSKYSVYGSTGTRGQAIAELERMGIVETRIFAGERGRGGEILKVRVAYDKEAVRQYIECKIERKD